MSLSHAEIGELLGAYALDAVDEDERQIVEDHLRDCPRCRAEVAEHQEVAAQLAFAGADAPTGLWSKIADALSSAEPGATEAAELGRMYPLPRRQPPVPRRWTVALGVAAAVIVAAFAGLGWQLHSEQRKVAAISQAVGSTSEIQHRMSELTADPSSTVVHLTSANHSVSLNVVVGADGEGFLQTNGTLPALPASQTYELWGLSGDRAVALGLLGPHPQVVAFAAEPGTITGMAVTAEQAGGTSTPTSTPVASGAVPA